MTHYAIKYLCEEQNEMSSDINCSCTENRDQSFEFLLLQFTDKSRHLYFGSL